MIRDILSVDTFRRAAGQREYELSPDVLIVLIDDGSSRVLDLDGVFFALPPIATEILLGILSSEADSVASRIAGRYATERARVRADLLRLAGDLVGRGVIHREGAAIPRNLLRRRVLSGLLPMLARGITAAPLALSHRARLLLGTAHVAMRWFGWAATIAAWPAPCRSPRCADDAQVIRTIDEAIRSAASGHLLDVACKERSLVCWWLLGMAGVEARMVLGIALYPFGCHCWCESRGRTLTDFADHCDRFSPVAYYI